MGQNPIYVIHFHPGWLRTGFPVKMDKMDTDTPNILDKVHDAQANHQSSNLSARFTSVTSKPHIFMVEIIEILNLTCVNLRKTDRDIKWVPRRRIESLTIYSTPWSSIR